MNIKLYGEEKRYSFFEFGGEDRELVERSKKTMIKK